MIQYLDHIDKILMLAINNDYPNFLDGIMYGVSAKLTWIPLYIAIIYLIFRKWGKNGWWILISLLLTVVAADQIASGLIKGAVERLRPSHDPSIMNQIALVHGYKSGLYGFVSSHAANAFGVAVLSALLFRNKSYSIFIFFWAVLIGYSRIYLGVHYPGDVLGGAIVGTAVAFLFYWLLKKFRPQIFEVQKSMQQQINIPFWTFLATFAGLMIYGYWFF